MRLFYLVSSCFHLSIFTASSYDFIKLLYNHHNLELQKIVRKKIFITTLVMPQGYQCQFKVYRSGVFYWDFVNDNHELAIHIFKGPEGDWYGSLSHHLGGMVQNNILITQAIFELAEFYKNLKG